MQRTKKHKAAFAPHIDLLPAVNMAVIVMHKMMGLFMMGNQEGLVMFRLFRLQFKLVWL